jgi:hypothetical protein
MGERERVLQAVAIPVSIVNNIISKTKGKFFTIGFKKVSDGSCREMTVRTGVRKGIKGTGVTKSTKTRRTVWDSDSNEFRTIPTDRVFYINAGEYRVYSDS